MPFQPLNHVLGILENHDKWEKRRQFRQLCTCWAEVVGKVVAAQTRPLYLQRNILYVATSSSVWAQNLVFERHRILTKLNDRLSYQLTDIRFSTAQWNAQKSSDANNSESYILWQNHPSQIRSQRTPSSSSLYSSSVQTSAYPHPIPNDPQTAFQGWANRIRERSQHLPTCPTCHCPTPPGELQRWSVCALCAAKQMKRS